MRILLLRPYPETAQFGLSPFFQTEPLGLMYLAAALRGAGHSVQLADMRFERRGIRSNSARSGQPDLVAISCLHILEAPAALQASRPDQSPQPEDFRRPRRPRNLCLSRKPLISTAPWTQSASAKGRRCCRRYATPSLIAARWTRSLRCCFLKETATFRRLASTRPMAGSGRRCPSPTGPSLPATRSATAV